jgi:hypothetical protein
VGREPREHDLFLEAEMFDEDVVQLFQVRFGGVPLGCVHRPGHRLMLPGHEFGEVFRKVSQGGPEQLVL